jgi:hypothetical protein
VLGKITGTGLLFCPKLAIHGAQRIVTAMESMKLPVASILAVKSNIWIQNNDLSPSRAGFFVYCAHFVQVAPVLFILVRMLGVKYV